MPRVAGGALIAAALCACGCGGRSALRPSTDSLALRADGSSSAKLVIDGARRLPDDATLVVVEGARRVRIESAVAQGDRIEAVVRAGVLPGEAIIEARAKGFVTARIAVHVNPDPGDADGDGIPDALELRDAADRDSFRRWFTFLAEAQYFITPPLPEITDCAALARFAFREALRTHEGTWARDLRLPMTPGIPPVRKYEYPFTPLGASIFRTADEAGMSSFAEFADAETLMRLNTVFVSRNLRRALPGDLLFYRQPGQKMPFHLMVFGGASHFDNARPQIIVYHTGPEGKRAGEVRRPTVAELLAHPEPRWRPVEGNTNFLGVYRWRILKD